MTEPQALAVLRAADPVRAAHAAALLWQMWHRSGRPELDALLREGIEAMEAQRLAEAETIFSRLIATAPQFAEGWNKRATVLWLLDDYEGSMADIDKTLALEPRHFGALWGLGAIQAAQQHDEEAIATFERALAVNPHMEGVTEQIEALKKRIKDKQI
jgi:tetratricopeptide (TPR) repeat protein